MNKLAAIPGARILFGGKELNGGDHTIPKVRGCLVLHHRHAFELTNHAKYTFASASIILPDFIITHLSSLRRCTAPSSPQPYLCP